MGHKFCNLCGELWHPNGKCKEEENVDKLFQEFRKKYQLKNCPYCKIVVIKKGVCNHMNCQYCGKHWCWLCDEIFISTEEHYGNRNSKCFNRMMNNDNRIICSKCDTEINDDTFRTFNCDHIICNNCFIDYLLINDAMIIYPEKVMDCIIIGCKGIKLVYGEPFIKFINGTNNEKLIKKYKKYILFFEYSLKPIFSLADYFDILFSFYELIFKLFDCWRNYWRLYDILKVIAIILGCIFVPVYIIIIPIYAHFIIKKTYYFKFLPEIKKQYNNKLLSLSILLGEEILSIVFLFTLISFHYIFMALFPTILSIILLIRNKIYGIQKCC